MVAADEETLLPRLGRHSTHRCGRRRPRTQPQVRLAPSWQRTLRVGACGNGATGPTAAAAAGRYVGCRGASQRLVYATAVVSLSVGVIVGAGRRHEGHIRVQEGGDGPVTLGCDRARQHAGARRIERVLACPQGGMVMGARASPQVALAVADDIANDCAVLPASPTSAKAQSQCAMMRGPCSITANGTPPRVLALGPR